MMKLTKKEINHIIGEIEYMAVRDTISYPSKSVSISNKLKSRIRSIKAMAMRENGNLPYSDIGDRLGVSSTRANELAVKGMRLANDIRYGDKSSNKKDLTLQLGHDGVAQLSMVLMSISCK